MEFLAHLPPPHDLLRHYDRKASHSVQPAEIPQPFLDAMSIRETVFVNEQRVPLENEYDADDARSFHWVTYASVATTGGPTAFSRGFDVSSNGAGRSSSKDDRRRSTATASKLPVGTIRLVPPPHPPHPTPSSQHQIDNSEAQASSPTSPQGSHVLHHNAPGGSTEEGSEPYIKLGRLAILPAYRRLGLGKLLVEAACEWASKHPEDILPKMDATTRERERAHARGRSEDSASGAGASESAGGGEGDYLSESMASGGGSEITMSSLMPWKGLILVHAQLNRLGTYEKWGFVRDEQLGTWWEEGIEHVAMWRRVSTKAER